MTAICRIFSHAFLFPMFLPRPLLRVFDLVRFFSHYNDRSHEGSVQLGIVFPDGIDVDRIVKLLPVRISDNQCPTFEDILDSISTFIFWDKLARGIDAYMKHLLDYEVAGSELARVYFPIEGSGHASLIALPMI